jgi:hypothetical protein
MISSELLAVGYILVALTIFTALVCLVWAIYFRERSTLGTSEFSDVGQRMLLVL